MMQSHIYIRPGLDRQGKPLHVRGPGGEILPQKPTRVENTGFWRRRLAIGDVVVVEKKPRKTKTKVDENDS